MEEKLMILVVDDNIDAAQSLADVLGLWGYRVAVVHDGIKALEQARLVKPDVVLLDIGLPGEDGYTVARRIRSEPGLEAVWLIALTGYGREDDRLRAEQAGFNHHFTKPVDLKVLRARLQEITRATAS